SWHLRTLASDGAALACTINGIIASTSASFNCSNRFPDRVLQLLQARSHDLFGLPVALLLVIELHAHLFGRGIGQVVFESAIWRDWRLKQRLVRQRNAWGQRHVGGAGHGGCGKCHDPADSKKRDAMFPGE